MEHGVGNAMGQAVMDWNRRYEENDTPWDKGEAHPVLRDMLAHDALSGRVLVPAAVPVTMSVNWRGTDLR
jgi:hypothetical protein